MNYTVYKIVNKTNGKIYVGAHQTKDLNDGYFGSGLVIRRAVEKYGVENFDKEILHIFDNSDDMFSKEAEIVNEEFVTRDDTYNLKLGGFGGWDYVNTNHNNKGNFRKTGNYGFKKRATDFTKLRIGLALYYANGGPRPFLGKFHTDETKKKIGDANSKRQSGKGNSQFGKMWIYNEDLKESKRIDKNTTIPEGWKKGRKIKF